MREEIEELLNKCNDRKLRIILDMLRILVER